MKLALAWVALGHYVTFLDEGTAREENGSEIFYLYDVVLACFNSLKDNNYFKNFLRNQHEMNAFIKVQKNDYWLYIKYSKLL